MPIPKFAGKVVNGQIVLDEPKQFKVYLCGFKHEAPIEVIVRKPSKKRSLNQNDYYWGVVVKILCEFTGNTLKDQHMDLRWRFLCRMDQKGRLYPESTTELSTVEYEEYLENIRRWASDPDDTESPHCYIPLPNEAHTEKVFVQL